MTISEKLSALRAVMKENGIDMYYIPTDDFHGSEYVGEHFKCREYISGFNGSAGCVVITQSYAGLWTDGRYFIQAEEQLAGTEFILNKSGNEGVPTAEKFILDNIGSGVLGFDGRVVSAKQARKFADKLGDRIKTDIDLMDSIWKDRPPLPMGRAWLLDEKYTGEASSHKLERIGKALSEKGADIFLLTSPDDICWLLNVRGNDVEYNPIVLSFLALSADRLIWFVDRRKLTDEITAALPFAEIRPYEEFYSYISKLPADITVYLDSGSVNYAVMKAIPENVKVKDGANLTLIPKAIKNDVECENFRKAHIKDGAAVTEFIYEIKTAPRKYTELSAAELMKSIRKAHGCIDESFEPICAYGSHGAIVHYSADEESNAQLLPEGLFLCDLGGHYLEGTTDMTRTIALGNITDEMKSAYTAVLKGHLALADAHFLHGCRGANLDILARKPLWEQALNYNHGTGHGVGYLMNVHEAPNSIRWRILNSPASDCVLEEGMITSDEPGLYLAGKFGIRIENLILCRKGTANEYGQFMYFEPLTLVPYDPDAVTPDMLTDHEKMLYNAYQKRVYDTISPLLDDEKREWLANETRPL